MMFSFDVSIDVFELTFCFDDRLLRIIVLSLIVINVRALSLIVINVRAFIALRATVVDMYLCN